MSEDARALCFGVALILFVVSALGIWHDRPYSFVAAGLAFFCLPFFWDAAEAAF